MWLEIIAGWCLAWYLFIIIVCTTGYIQLLRHYSKTPSKAVSPFLPLAEVPHVTAIRPIKGLEPYLYECLASTLRQDYPALKLTVYFCVSAHNDPAVPVVRRLLQDFPNYDATLFVEDEDSLLARSPTFLGPNPKIRNMSRAYREAKSDLVWIIDCNVWVGAGACGRMVDKLCGFSAEQAKRYKLVHHLPISVDVEGGETGGGWEGLLSGNTENTNHRKSHVGSRNRHAQPRDTGGGRLDEVFLSTSHAKFYVAINTVAVAPCIVGKSNMFRRSHLNYLTYRLSSPTPATPHPPSSTDSLLPGIGIDYFSYNICEDHLIGDLLWRSSIPSEPSIGNHGLVFGDLAIQPIASMNVGSYIARRVRWLRVRKFTVMLATLVEPGTESLLCSAYGAFGLIKTPWTRTPLGLSDSWLTFLALWLLSVVGWAAVDWTVHLLLHSGRTIEIGENAHIPVFARPLQRFSRRSFAQWLAAWVIREALALPIWVWAFWGGTTVVWRDRKFWVGMDMRVHEIDDQKAQRQSNGTAAGGKARKD